MKFKNLHQQRNPLLIGNVWDAPSTKMAEKLNFQAIGTSSAAIAALLGYEDGEEMSFSELEYMVGRIVANTNLPLSVDIESGYSRNPSTIANHIKRLSVLGVVGINIEDSIVDPQRTLLKAEEFSNTLSEIKEILDKENIDVFMNVRTDTFLLYHPKVIEETKRRIQLYEAVGANGIFIPCIKQETDIKTMVSATNLPINVMAVPNLPSFETLTTIGVKRISMGNFLFDNMYQHFEKVNQSIITQQSFNPIF